MEDDSYLFRGTTEGWPGNESYQELGVTCTTTDPLVATLFAIECRNHGRAVVLAVRRRIFEELIAPPNYFDIIEAAVNVSIPPVEFARQAEVVLSVDQALDILAEIGLVHLPVRISERYLLQREIELSHATGKRLSPEQIQQFARRMRGLEP